jgi:Zn-dependent protease with chaperone function
MLARELRTRRERTLFTISVIVSALCWLVLVVSVVGIPPLLLASLAALAAHRSFMARMIGGGVRVGPRQLPHLMRRVEAAAHKLGMERVPEAYVVQRGGRLRAFATKMFSRRFIVISSALLEAADTDDGTGRASELDFVIGQTLGGLATGQVAARPFLLPARILPLLGPAYARACAYTRDRCGHSVTGDLELSSRALAILAAGPLAARRIDLDAFVDQRRETRRFWMAVRELGGGQPFLAKRVAALRARHAQTPLEPVRRNPLAYLFAPFLGVATGSPQSVLLVALIAIGVVVAVVLPRLKDQAGTGSMPGGSTYHFDSDKDPFLAPDR